MSHKIFNTELNEEELYKYNSMKRVYENNNPSNKGMSQEQIDNFIYQNIVREKIRKWTKHQHLIPDDEINQIALIAAELLRDEFINSGESKSIFNFYTAITFGMSLQKITEPKVNQVME